MMKLNKKINFSDYYTLKKCINCLKDKESGYGCENHDYIMGGSYIKMAYDFYFKAHKNEPKKWDYDPDNKIFYNCLNPNPKIKHKTYTFTNGEKISLKNIYSPFHKDFKPKNFILIKKGKPTVDEKNIEIQKNIDQKWHFFVSVLMYLDVANDKDSALNIYCNENKEYNKYLIGNVKGIELTNKNWYVHGQNDIKRYPTTKPKTTDYLGLVNYLFDQLSMCHN